MCYFNSIEDLLCRMKDPSVKVYYHLFCHSYKSIAQCTLCYNVVLFNFGTGCFRSTWPSVAHSYVCWVLKVSKKGRFDCNLFCSISLISVGFAKFPLKDGYRQSSPLMRPIRFGTVDAQSAGNCISKFLDFKLLVVKISKTLIL